MVVARNGCGVAGRDRWGDIEKNGERSLDFPLVYVCGHPTACWGCDTIAPQSETGAAMVLGLSAASSTVNGKFISVKDMNFGISSST